MLRARSSASRLVSPTPTSSLRAWQVRICKALLEEDEAWDEAEARALTEGAWREDARGMRAISRSMFNDSLFELTDMWCARAAPAIDLLNAQATACHALRTAGRSRQVRMSTSTFCAGCTRGSLSC